MPKFWEIPWEGWASSCTGKGSQTQCAPCWEQQEEREQLVEHQGEDQDDSTVPSGLAGWTTVEPPTQQLTWTRSSTHILAPAQPQGNGRILPFESQLSKTFGNMGATVMCADPGTLTNLSSVTLLARSGFCQGNVKGQQVDYSNFPSLL